MGVYVMGVGAPQSIIHHHRIIVTKTIYPTCQTHRYNWQRALGSDHRRALAVATGILTITVGKRMNFIVIIVSKVSIHMCWCGGRHISLCWRTATYTRGHAAEEPKN